jgi:putative transposase
VDCALACLARGRPVRLVCEALGVARSNVTARKRRPANWTDRRTAHSKADDSAALDAIRAVVHDLATYGYRRVWGVLRLGGTVINHKRVYRVMRDHGFAVPPSAASCEPATA